MDLEQIIKRLDWLDDERRKDKLTIATLEEKVNNLAGNIPSLLQQIKEQSLELARLAGAMPRFDQLETMIGQIRVETNRTVEAAERQRVERDLRFGHGAPRQCRLCPSRPAATRS